MYTLSILIDFVLLHNFDFARHKISRCTIMFCMKILELQKGTKEITLSSSLRTLIIYFDDKPITFTLLIASCINSMSSLCTFAHTIQQKQSFTVYFFAHNVSIIT